MLCETVFDWARLEEQRGAAEALMLDVAIAEMGELTKIVVAAKLCCV